jgi:hypothetical protein
VEQAVMVELVLEQTQSLVQAAVERPEEELMSSIFLHLLEHTLQKPLDRLVLQDQE